MNPDDEKVVLTIGGHEFPVVPGHYSAVYPCVRCGCLMDEARDVKCTPKEPETDPAQSQDSGPAV
jgi:hypothetical protein